jgi:hypothetical protein
MPLPLPHSDPHNIHSDQHNIHCTYMVLLKGPRGLYMGLKSEKYYPMCIKQSLTKNIGIYSDISSMIACNAMKLRTMQANHIYKK